MGLLFVSRGSHVALKVPSSGGAAQALGPLRLGCELRLGSSEAKMGPEPKASLHSVVKPPREGFAADGRLFRFAQQPVVCGLGGFEGSEAAH